MSGPRRQRLRFETFEHDVQPDGRCRVRIRLEWMGGVLEGVADGTHTPQGDLRTAAHATLDAARRGAADRIELSLSGAKIIRAFDESIVVAAVRARVDGADHRLLGVKAVGDAGAVAACARAVLSALNRILERHVGHPRGADLPDGTT